MMIMTATTMVFMVGESDDDDEIVCVGVGNHLWTAAMSPMITITKYLAMEIMFLMAW